MYGFQEALWAWTFLDFLRFTDVSKWDAARMQKYELDYALLGEQVN